MPEDKSAPWAPNQAQGSRPVHEALHEGFRADRVLCEDGFCLGVMRVVDDGAPYRGVPEAACPICGRRAPITGALDARG